MQDDIQDRLKRIERKLDWAAEMSLVAAMAAIVLVLQQVLLSIGAKGPSIFGPIAGMIAGGVAMRWAYRRLLTRNNAALK